MKNGFTLLSLVFGGTSLLVSVDAAEAAVMIPVTCDGMQVGTIRVDFIPTGTGVAGGFQTTPMFPTLADAAAKCGEDHFNWYQRIIADNKPPVDAGGNRLAPPYDDPPMGGFGDDPNTPGDDTQWADNLPWYWDETVPPANTPGFNPAYQLSNNVVGGDFLVYADTPVGLPGTMLSFETRLASINADGSLHNLYGGFSWDFVIPGGAGNLQGRRNIPEPSSIVSLLALSGLGLVTLKRRV